MIDKFVNQSSSVEAHIPQYTAKGFSVYPSGINRIRVKPSASKVTILRLDPRDTPDYPDSGSLAYRAREKSEGRSTFEWVSPEVGANGWFAAFAFEPPPLPSGPIFPGIWFLGTDAVDPLLPPSSVRWDEERGVLVRARAYDRTISNIDLAVNLWVRGLVEEYASRLRPPPSVETETKRARK